MSLVLTLSLYVVGVLIITGAVYLWGGKIPLDMATYILEKCETAINRVIIVTIYSILVLMQMKVASKVFTESEAQEIANAIQIGPVSISPWEGGLFVLLAWMAVPIAILNMRLVYYCCNYDADTIMTDEFWSDRV